MVACFNILAESKNRNLDGNLYKEASVQGIFLASQCSQWLHENVHLKDPKAKG